MQCLPVHLYGHLRQFTWVKCETRDMECVVEIENIHLVNWVKDHKPTIGFMMKRHQDSRLKTEDLFSSPSLSLSPSRNWQGFYLNYSGSCTHRIWRKYCIQTNQIQPNTASLTKPASQPHTHTGETNVLVVEFNSWTTNLALSLFSGPLPVLAFSVLE